MWLLIIEDCETQIIWLWKPQNVGNTICLLSANEFCEYLLHASFILAFGDLFSAIVLSVEIGYPGSKVYCYYFFIISNGFVNKFLWTQPQWWILILCQIHQRSRPYIYCIDFGLSVFLFVLLSVASSKLLSCRKCRRMPRLHMMNNEKKWPGKFKVINQVQGQTEHQNVN